MHRHVYPLHILPLLPSSVPACRKGLVKITFAIPDHIWHQTTEQVK